MVILPSLFCGELGLWSYLSEADRAAPGSPCSRKDSVQEETWAKTRGCFTRGEVVGEFGKPRQREDKAVILPEVMSSAPRGKSRAWSGEWQTGAEGWSKITVSCWRGKVNVVFPSCVTLLPRLLGANKQLWTIPSLLSFCVCSLSGGHIREPPGAGNGPSPDTQFQTAANQPEQQRAASLGAATGTPCPPALKSPYGHPFLTQRDIL